VKLRKNLALHLLWGGGGSQVPQILAKKKKDFIGSLYEQHAMVSAYTFLVVQPFLGRSSVHSIQCYNRKYRG
jgi:hypothetical protein